MGRDLGTYHVRVIFTDGRGFIQEWNTGVHYTEGRESCSPLDATRLSTLYDSEQDLAENIRYMFLHGNYSCDCNMRLFLARAYQEKVPEEDYGFPCGNTLIIKSIDLIRPDGSECHIQVDESHD